MEVDPQLLDDIFRSALEQQADQRAIYVDERCAGNQGLLQAVSRLLAAADSADDEITVCLEAARRHWLRELAGDSDQEIENLSGQRIGPWRIDRPLARGGVASVYIAHRDDGQFEQRAAFKVLRRGLDTDDVIARFRTERQILSSLEHPAISQLLDGGVLADGRPYLVLEYVDGASITAHCDAARADIRAQLRLVIEVLRVLHHAHKHLVVHRDIKPSNVMITTEGRVKLLDFGIAKLLDQSTVPGASTSTRTGVALLTPGYGSPEQHAGVAVTTASDIYQVGGVLYELLSGERPPRAAMLGEHAPPAPPSSVIRRVSRRKQVRGDLDAIVCKAMHADPSQRYASAPEMVTDVIRFLEGQPVLARPDTLAYRLYKLTRRRPVTVAAVAVVVLLGVAHIVSLTNFNRQIRIEQQRASAAQSFMVDLLGSADPHRPAGMRGGKDMLVIDALDVGIERLRDNSYGDDDVLRASLLVTIAGVYGSLDQHQKSIEARADALKLERSLYGDISEAVISSLRELGHQYRTIGDYDAAEPYYAEQLAAAHEFFPADHPEAGVAESAYALIQLRRGNLDASRTLLEAAVTKLQRSRNGYARESINAMVALAGVRGADAKEETLQMLAEAQRLADAEFGADSPLAALVTTRYAASLSLFGELQAARKSYAAAIAIYEKRLGRSHGATLAALIGLGDLHLRAGRLRAAEQTYIEVLEHYSEKYGPAHMGVATSYQKLAEATSAQGRYAEAAPLYRLAYDSRVAVLGTDNALVYTPLLPMADAQIRAGAFADAEATAGLAASNLAGVVGFAQQEAQARCLMAQAMDGPRSTVGARTTVDAPGARQSTTARTGIDPSRCYTPSP